MQPSGLFLSDLTTIGQIKLAGGTDTRFTSAMKRFFQLGALVSLLSIAVSASIAEPLEPGKKVPPVKSTDSENKPFDVTAHLKQGMTLVFFFPKANTGG